MLSNVPITATSQLSTLPKSEDLMSALLLEDVARRRPSVDENVSLTGNCPADSSSFAYFKTPYELSAASRGYEMRHFQSATPFSQSVSSVPITASPPAAEHGNNCISTNNNNNGFCDSVYLGWDSTGLAPGNPMTTMSYYDESLPDCGASVGNCSEMSVGAHNVSSVQPSFSRSGSNFNCGPEVIVIRMLMSGKEVGCIIGKKGSNVKRYREESGARINISDCTSPERIVTIIGQIMQIKKAFELISQKFEDDFQQGMNRDEVSFSTAGELSSPNPLTSSPPITLRLLVAGPQCGLVIGKGGAKIKEIRELTGASVQVASEVLHQSTERVVTISGCTKAISNCIKVICELLQENPSRCPIIPYKPRPTSIINSVPGSPAQSGFGCSSTANQTSVNSGGTLLPSLAANNPFNSLGSAELYKNLLLPSNSMYGLAGSNSPLMGLASQSLAQQQALLAAAAAATAASIPPPGANLPTNGSTAGPADSFQSLAGLLPSNHQGTGLITSMSTSNCSLSATSEAERAATFYMPHDDKSTHSTTLISDVQSSSSSSSFPASSNLPPSNFSPSLGDMFRLPTGTLPASQSAASAMANSSSAFLAAMAAAAALAASYPQPATNYLPIGFNAADTSFLSYTGMPPLLPPYHQQHQPSAHLHHASLRQSAQYSQEMVIPNELIGCVIGRGGNKINEIRQSSGAQIKISNVESGGKDRKITISGTADQVQIARILIQQSIETHRQILTMNILCAANNAVDSGDKLCELLPSTVSDLASTLLSSSSLTPASYLPCQPTIPDLNLLLLNSYQQLASVQCNQAQIYDPSTNATRTASTDGSPQLSAHHQSNSLKSKMRPHVASNWSSCKFSPY